MEYIRKFFNSTLFMILSYLYTVLCWYLKDQNMAIIFYITCAFIIILIDAKRTTIATLGMCAIINYRDTLFSSNSKVIYIAICFLVPLFVYDVIRHKPKSNNAIFMSLVAILIASLLSLTNVFKENQNDALVGILKVTIYVIIFYYCLINHSDNDYQYISKSIVMLGFAIILEYALYIITYEGTRLWTKDIALGWGISNSVSMMFLITIPVTIYLFLEYPKHVYLIVLTVLELLAIFLMLCKGAYLAIIVLVIPFAIVLYFMLSKGIKRKIYLSCIIGILLIFIGSMIYILNNKEIMDGIKNYFEAVINRGGLLRDESRIVIYETGLNIFKKFPLFGSGVNTASYYLVLNDFSPLLKHYHNYAIQALATTGIFGTLAVAFFAFSTLKACFIKQRFNVCIGFAFIALAIHGLVDNTFYNPIIMIVLVFTLPSLLKKKELMAKGL